VSGKRSQETEVVVEGRALRLARLDKVFYPATGFTKGQVIDYYRRVAPVLLPHLRDRPLTLKRYPEGATGPYFYEKRSPPYRPDWFRTEAVWSEGNQEYIDYCVVDDLPSLIWIANLADLELHPSLSFHDPVDRPTVVAFDLDPGPPAGLAECCRVALLLREIFQGLELDSFPKTSGSKGLQIYLPLNTPVDYGQTKAFARAAAELLEARYPELVVSQMKKSLRQGKVLVDWSQNDAHKTTVCVYSLRARERPTVSTPVTWQEVIRAARSGDANALVFEAEAVLARVARSGDLFAPVLTLRQALPARSSVERDVAARHSPSPARE
jgi:bifunctional non-homologous end joining protein LigD